MDIAGHVSKRMVKHYSHIRMEAKRRAVASLIPDEKSNVKDTVETGPKTGPEAVSKKMGKVAV